MSVNVSLTEVVGGCLGGLLLCALIGLALRSVIFFVFNFLYFLSPRLAKKIALMKRRGQEKAVAVIITVNLHCTQKILHSRPGGITGLGLGAPVKKFLCCHSMTMGFDRKIHSPVLVVVTLH